MPFTTDYAHNVLNYIFGKTKTLAAPTDVYLALSSNDPEADNGVFNELSGGGYTRVHISTTSGNYPNMMGTPTGRSITNSKQINWNKATADWQDIKGFALWTALTGGTMIYYGKITNEGGKVEVNSGAVALFDPGALKISIASTDVDE